MATVAGNDANQMGIICLAVFIPVLVAAVAVLYFTTLRPLRTKSPEEAVRYVRDHGRKKHRNDDLVTFARRFTTRRGRKNRRPALIFITVMTTLWIVLAIVIVAMGDAVSILFYFGIGLLLVSMCAFYWYTDYILRTQNAVFNRYLDEAD